VVQCRAGSGLTPACQTRPGALAGMFRFPAFSSKPYPGRHYTQNIVGKRKPEEKKYMFDKQFCILLELSITRTFRQSADLEQRRCWCNGIVLPDNDALDLIEDVLRTRQLTAKAWIDEGWGTDEALQFLYDLRLNFRDEAIDRLKNGDRLDLCIPHDALNSWMTIDKENKTIDAELM
jgi:hypothetical protein